MDGLAAAVDAAVEVELLEDLDVAGLVFRQVGEVGVVPLAAHAQALEALALAVELLGGVLAADLAEGGGVDLLHLFRAELVFNLVLDGQAVAVPAGHVGSVVAAHALVFDDDVLEHLVEGVADVDGAVGVRGAVVQDEGGVVLVGLEDLGVEVHLLPLLEALGLALGQAGLHLEAGLREVHGVLVIGFVRHLYLALLW